MQWCLQRFSLHFARHLATMMVLFLGLQEASAAGIEAFVGNYVGSAVVERQGKTEMRDMSVQISKSGKGFKVGWKSIIQRADGSTKESAYSIDFLPTRRDNIYYSAMKNDVFGHAVPLNPMKGEPYVWSRIIGDTLTVFSLHVDEEGSYEMQQYDRTLVEGGIQLNYQRVRNGTPLKAINALLKRS